MTRAFWASLPLVILGAGAAMAKPIIPETGSLAGECTSTTYTTGNAPRPPATWQPTWTVTAHASTTTSTAAVDCSGCAHLQTEKVLVNYLQPTGPSPMVVKTVVATEPAVVTKAYCKQPPSAQPLRYGQFEAPPPGPDPTPTTASSPGHSGSGSTTSCPKHLFHAPAFTWGPTSTVWTSTATVTHKINCGGCDTLQINYLPLGPGPAVFFTTTVTASTASTMTIPVCGGTGTPEAFGKRVAEASTSHYYQAPPMEVHTALPANDGDGPACTKKSAVEPSIPNHTFTSYASTVTATRSVDCGGCALEWSTPVVYFFAPILLTATETAIAPSTSIEMACATSTAAA
ncbi:hypothetical protein PWT90_05403 [Aphanocladium album]|nr:hypothetical protein PWT90_05403 [Aphanocladium album]